MNDFKHFMLKEIYDQPETAKNWQNYLIKHSENGKYQIKYPFDTEFLEKVERIEIIACGTSKHAAMVGSFLLEQFSGIPTNVFYASEFDITSSSTAKHINYRVLIWRNC